jgi:hypothetical protein
MARRANNPFDDPTANGTASSNGQAQGRRERTESPANALVNIGQL